MIQKLNIPIQELDTVVLLRDLPEHHLKQGDVGAVVHRYSDGEAFEVEFVDENGDTHTLLTLMSADIQSTSHPQPVAVTLLVSYAQADKTWRDRLIPHLEVLKRQGTINTWSDHDISAETEWKEAIATTANTASIILLLVSADFLDAGSRYYVEIKQALERQQDSKSCIIPVLLKPCNWGATPFNALQVLPRSGQPIASWDNPDAAFFEVVQGIRRVVEQLSS